MSACSHRLADLPDGLLCTQTGPHRMRHPTGHYPPLKTGAGRHRKPTPAVDVTRLPCPATLGSETHEIVWRRGRTVCAWCSVEWAAIDAEARGGAA